MTLFCSDVAADPTAIGDLERALKSRVDVCKRTAIATSIGKSVSELLRSMSSMDYIVTCRFHGSVFSHLLKKPMIALSHPPKMARLMADLELSNYCFDIGDFGITAFERGIRFAYKKSRGLADTLE